MTYSSSIRRRPNALNLVHQMRLLQRFGKDGERELKVPGMCLYAGMVL